GGRGDLRGAGQLLCRSWRTSQLRINHRGKVGALCGRRQSCLRAHSERGNLLQVIAFPVPSRTLGSRQVVRHRSLEPTFGGSNPPSPATLTHQWLSRTAPATAV